MLETPGHDEEAVYPYVHGDLRALSCDEPTEFHFLHSLLTQWCVNRRAKKQRQSHRTADTTRFLNEYGIEVVKAGVET